jgi:hypothetical protein
MGNRFICRLTILCPLKRENGPGIALQIARKDSPEVRKTGSPKIMSK